MWRGLYNATDDSISGLYIPIPERELYWAAILTGSVTNVHSSKLLLQIAPYIPLSPFDARMVYNAQDGSLSMPLWYVLWLMAQN